MSAEIIIPELVIQTTGKISQSNLPAVRDALRAWLGGINRNLSTDEEFGQAELDVKNLKKVEDALRKAAMKAIDDKIAELIKDANDAADEARIPRLDLEKIIATRKDQVKSEIIEEFIGKFDIDPKDARRHYLAGLQNAIKGKRTVDSMRTACRTLQASLQAGILATRDVLDRFIAKFPEDMIPDRRELELKPSDAVEAELVRRVQAKKAAEEQAKLRAEAAAAKAEADKAKAALAESTKPAVAGIPASTATDPAEAAKPATEEPTPSLADGISAEDEWKEFKASCMAAFAPLKAVREKLTHSRNIAKAQVFANGINQLWKDEMQ
jgi:hypothetical protein